MISNNKLTLQSKLNRGFTLVELVITVAIVGILVTVGIPSFSDMMANSRMTSLTNDLVSEIYVARSEAVKRNVAVSICSSTDQATCANSNNWATGWIIFTDFGVPGVVDGVDQILFIHQPANGNMTLNVDRSFTRFLPTGFST